MIKLINYKYFLIFLPVLFSFSIYVFADIQPDMTWRPTQQAATDSTGNGLFGGFDWNVLGCDALSDSRSVEIEEKPDYAIGVNGLGSLHGNSIIDVNTQYAEAGNTEIEIRGTPELSYKLDGSRQVEFENDLSTTDGGTELSGGNRKLSDILYSDGLDLSEGMLPLADTLNKLVPHYIREFGKNAPGFIKRTDVSVNFQEDLEPLWSVETVQPLYQTSETLRHTLFFQGRYAHDKGSNADTDTLNLGLGYRYLNSNGRWMAGVNAFYDHEFDHRHERVGAGIEIIGQFASIHSNYYNALSGRRTISRSGGVITEQKALDGWDIEGQVQVPFMPWVYGGVKAFEWDGEDTSNLDGFRFFCLMNITKNAVLEFGRIDDDTGDSNFVAFNFTFGGPKRIQYTMTDNFVMPTVFTGRDLKDQTLRKIRRNNNIVVEETKTNSSVGLTIGRGT